MKPREIYASNFSWRLLISILSNPSLSHDLIFTLHISIFCLFLKMFCLLVLEKADISSHILCSYKVQSSSKKDLGGPLQHQLSLVQMAPKTTTMFTNFAAFVLDRIHCGASGIVSSMFYAWHQAKLSCYSTD